MYVYEREIQFSQDGTVLSLNLAPANSSLKVALSKGTQVTLHELQLPLSPLEYDEKFLKHSAAVKNLDGVTNADIAELFNNIQIETQAKFSLELYSEKKSFDVHNVKHDSDYKIDAMVLKDGTNLSTPGQILLKTKELLKHMHYLDDDERWKKKRILQLDKIKAVTYKTINRGKDFFVNFTILSDSALLTIPRPLKIDSRVHGFMSVIFFHSVGSPLMYLDIGKSITKQKFDMGSMPDEISGIARLLYEDRVFKKLIAYLDFPSPASKLQPLVVYMNHMEQKYYLEVQNDFFMYVSTPVRNIMKQGSFWSKVISSESTDDLFRRKKWAGEYDPHTEKDLELITNLMEKSGMKMHRLLLRKTKFPGVKVEPNTKWIGKMLKMDLTSQIKTKTAFTKNIKLPLIVPVGDPKDNHDCVSFKRENILNTLTTDYIANTLPPFDPTKIKMNKSELNTVYAVYNEHLKKQYYTTNNEHIPLLGMCVANRLFENKEGKEDGVSHKYESIITQPIFSHISDRVQISSLDFLIKTVGGRSRPIETLHLPAKNVLFELSTPSSERNMDFADSRTILVSAETTSTVNNPTDATVKDWELLMQMKRHLANGKRIYCQLKGMVFPTKIKRDVSMLIISVSGWTFNSISYINGIPTRALGFVALNKVPNFYSLTDDNLLQSVTFSTSKDAGISKPFEVSDVDDLKNFSIEIRDQNNTLVELPDGKYPMFVLQFTFP